MYARSWDKMVRDDVMMLVYIHLHDIDRGL